MGKRASCTCPFSTLLVSSFSLPLQSVRGEGLASSFGKPSAQLTEGVTARSSLLFPPMDPFRLCGPPFPGMPPASRASRPCAGYDACEDLQSSIVLARPLMDPFRPCGPHPGRPPASRASRPRARSYDACEDLQLSFVLARPSMDLFHRFAVPLPRARGRLRFDAQFVGYRAEGCIPPGGAQRLPAGLGPNTKGSSRRMSERRGRRRNFFAARSMLGHI